MESLSLNLSDLQIDPNFMKESPRPQRWIDGYMLPFGNLTILQTGSGAGKSTAIRKAALSYSARGEFHCFGHAQHASAGRVVILSGEETADNIRTSILSIPGAMADYEEAMSKGNLLLVSLLDARGKNGLTDLFDEKGLTTKFGEKVFDDIREFRPDLLVIDTLTSVSATEYLDGVSAKNAVLFLSGFCGQIGCAGISVGHVGKGTNEKVTEDIEHEGLIAMGRGSGLLVASSRHAIVLARAPKGMFSMLSTEEGDEVWIGTLKSNIEHEAARTVFPVIRSKEKRTLIATAGGVALSAVAEVHDEEVMSALEDILYAVIKVTANAHQPLAESGKVSAEGLSSTLLAPLLPRGVTRKMISSVVAKLVRDQRVTIVRSSRTGSPLLDVVGGIYATNLDPATGRPPDFKKGAPDIGGLSAQIDHELENLQRSAKAPDIKMACIEPPF